jgi:hypothetical protein
MLHQALAAWDPAVEELEDPADNPLIHTLTTLTANGGTLRNTFKSTTLLYNGLIPSKTGCVKGDIDKEVAGVKVHLINDRWRNNALVLQLVDADYVRNLEDDEQPLDRLRVQNPPDIFRKIILSDGTIIRLTDDKDDDGLEGDSPEYEVYGGLTARDEESFLYESTVFWHWNDGDQPDLCYADTEEYRTAFLEFTGRVPVKMFLEQLEDATGLSTFEELAERVEELETCVDTPASCEEQREAIQDWVERAETIGEIRVSDPGYENTPSDNGGSLSGEPQVMGGGISEGGKTSGPNFNAGRRTWTDIMPQ